MIGVSVVDNDRMLLEGMATWLQRTPDLRVESTATTVGALVGMAPASPVVLLDLDLGDLSDPADNVRRLVALGYLVVVVTIVPDPSYIAAVTEAGASAYVSKSERLEHLADVVRDVVSGSSALTADHAFWLARDVRDDRPHLSEREREVLVAYGRGMTVDAVGRMLGIASGTVRTHLGRVKQKYVAAGRPIRHRGQYSERAQEDGLATLLPRPRPPRSRVTESH